MTSDLVYILCAVTSILCAVLLARAYRERKSRVLRLSTWCFLGLAVNNAVLVADRMIVPHVDLSLVRAGTAVAAMALLVVGMIWGEAR
jgi:hypothetical protein